jgi:isoquinoline 1-oxidoreductase beta subunit
MQRRQFLQAGAATASALWLGVSGTTQTVWAASAELTTPWLKISVDNHLTVFSARSEMGQDVYTTLALLIAEELDHPFDRIRVEFAPSNAAIYGNAMLGGIQLTGSSTSIRDGWGKLRQVGATARALLLQAAAKKWGVAVTECRAADGVVKSGRHQASYGELALLAAHESLAEPAKPKTADQYRLIGRRLPRLDTRDKVLGKAEFGIDVRQPGMLSAGVSMCPVIGGKPIAVDDAQARAIAGVRGIYTLPDGVAVVADDFHIVQQAREKLQIRWDTSGLPSVPDNAAIEAQLTRAADNTSGFVVKQIGQAPAISEQKAGWQAEYRQPMLAHAALEPMNCSVHLQGDVCHVWGPFQFPQGVSNVAKAITGLALENIHVHTTFIGGGFGRKLELDCVSQAVWIAKLSQKPIRLTWSREDDTQHDFYRPPALHRFAARLGADGRVEMLTGKLVSPSVLKHFAPPLVSKGVDAYMVEGLQDFPYDIPHLRLESVMEDVGVRVGFWRGVSHNLNAFAIESLMDELALAGGQDPVAFRMRHLQSHPRAQAVLQTLAQKVALGNPLPAGRHMGMALCHCYGSYVAVAAEVSSHDGQPRVHKLSCVIDAGIALRPDQIEAQIEGGLLWGYSSAMRNRITVQNGAVVEDNFDTYPMLRFADVPDVDVHVMSTGHPPGGVGEAGVPAAAPAIANAWARASGQRLRSMPFVTA